MFLVELIVIELVYAHQIVKGIGSFLSVAVMNLELVRYWELGVSHPND